MNLKFTKMQSLGNDFVMLNGVNESIEMTEQIARHIAHRRFGIGCDQILVAESGQKNGNDGGKSGYRLRIFNSDGSEVGQCGNGARCFARYLHDQGLTRDQRINIRTKTTKMQLHLKPDGSVTVDMGVPEFAPAKIPLAVTEPASRYQANTGCGDIEFYAVGLGNPHCVIQVSRVDTADVQIIGSAMENNPLFPERINVGFRQIISRQKIKLRVYERGAGETLGCGSGACAAVATGIRDGLLDSEVEVVLPGGSARVSWQGGASPIFLNGPVHKVYQGILEVQREHVQAVIAA